MSESYEIDYNCFVFALRLMLYYTIFSLSFFVGYFVIFDKTVCNCLLLHVSD